MIEKLSQGTVAEFESFLRAGPEKPYYELVNGRIVEKSMPTDVHATIVNRLCFWLTLWARERGLGEPGPERRFVFPGDTQNSRQPDVSLILDPDVSLILDPDAPLVWQGPVYRVPDLVAEVQSPGDTPGEMREKARFYRDSGVLLTLLLFPLEKRVEMWRPGLEVESVGPGAAICDDVLLPGFSLSTAELFAERRGGQGQS